MSTMINANPVLKRWDIMALALFAAHSGWKAGLRTEVALDGLHFVICKPEVLHVAQRLAVLRMTDVHYKRFVAAPEHPQQVKPLDKVLLCPPALGFERALVEVVVPRCAGKGKVIRQQDIERAPVGLPPSRIVFTDNLFGFRAQYGGCLCTCTYRHANGRQHANCCLDCGSAGHWRFSHDVFPPLRCRSSEKRASSLSSAPVQPPSW